MTITVKEFYDQHPINESQILSKLAAEGIARDAITAEDLSRYDQDHYDALSATDALVDALKIGAGTTVLDLCSGMGGTCRYLCYRYGAIVLGVDITESRLEGARRLTALVGLADKVRYEHGNVAHLELGDRTFQCIVSQESFLHITDRESLFAGCYRALAPRGRIGFTDWVASPSLGEAARQRFADKFAAPRIAGFDEYLSLLAAAGFVDVTATDLAAQWRVILRDRLEMYCSLEGETVARFGRERFESYIDTYEFFVDQIDSGALGGGRFVAWKPSTS